MAHIVTDRYTMTDRFLFVSGAGPTLGGAAAPVMVGAAAPVARR